MTTAFIFPIWIHGWKLVLVIAIALLAAFRLYKWWKVVGTLRDLFGDPDRSEATRRVGIPAALILFLCLVLLVIPSRPKSIYDSDLPVLTHIFAANYSDQPGKMRIGEQVEYFDAHETREVKVHSGLTSDHVEAWLDDELVFDTPIAKGYYIANFSNDINVVAMEVIYGGSYGYEGPRMEMQSGPGVKQFSEERHIFEIYSFKELPPEEVEVYQQQYMPELRSVQNWSIKTYTDSELLGRVLGGSGY